MKRVSSTVLVAAVVLAADPVAQQTPGTFTAYGAGTAPCTSWTEQLKDTNVRARNLQWVLGFVSAAGVFAGIQLKVDADGIEPFVTAYCQEHPADTITTAAATLVGKLRQ